MHSRRSRQSRRGQSAVEFAIVAPIFFFLFYTVFNGGLFLYSRVGAQDATQYGALTVAAMGRDPTADTTAITRMRQGELGTSSLIKVTEIDIYKMIQPTSGVLAEATTGCAGTGAHPCRNSYKLDGTLCTSCTAQYANNSGTVYWAPSTRNVTKGTSDFGEITVYFTYRSTYTVFPNIATSFNVDFRMEPQT
jgi:hypothetical protein